MLACPYEETQMPDGSVISTFCSGVGECVNDPKVTVNDTQCDANGGTAPWSASTAPAHGGANGLGVAQSLPPGDGDPALNA